MTTRQFSDEFDVLLDSFSHKEKMGDNPQHVVLDEYEKSVFLTKAQKELVLAYYTGRNIEGEGIEQTERVRRYLSNLVKESTLSPITTTNGLPLGVSSSSKFFTLPDDLWFITYEAAAVNSDDCHNGTTLDGIPVTQDEYHKIKRNPFRGASSRRVLRLDLSEQVIEVISKYEVASYYVRYLLKPSPIVLVDLPDGLIIDGETTTTECKLHEALHQEILDRAVQMALASKSISRNKE